MNYLTKECTDFISLSQELKRTEERANLLKGKIQRIKEASHKDNVIQKLIETICMGMGVEKEVVLSNTRKESVCIPRHILRYMLRMNGLTYTDIAKVTSPEGREANHATIINSVNITEGALAVNCSKFEVYFSKVSQLIDNQLFKSEISDVA